MTALKRGFNEKGRSFFYVALLSVPVLVLLFLLPYLSTNVNGEKAYISGFQSFALFSDLQDISHYAAGLLIVSLLLSCCLIIPVLVGFLGPESWKGKTALSAFGIYVIKLIVEIAITILYSQTETNVVLSLGSYLMPLFTAVLGFLFVFSYVNLRDAKGTLFHKKEKKK